MREEENTAVLRRKGEGQRQHERGACLWRCSSVDVVYLFVDGCSSAFLKCSMVAANWLSCGCEVDAPAVLELLGAAAEAA